jgi:membrane glycosyltransferase
LAEKAYQQPPAPQRLDVTLAALLQDWRGALGRARRYVAALGLDSAQAEALALQAVEDSVTQSEWPPEADAFSQTIGALRHEIVAQQGRGRKEDEARGFFDWRLRRLFGKDGSTPQPLPPIVRSSMQPHRLERRGLFGRRLVAAAEAAGADAGPKQREGRVPRAVRAMRVRLRWVREAFWRRSVLLVLILIPTFIASEFMIQVLPFQGRTVLEMVIVAFFGALFGWISIGFWTALTGFWLLLTRRDRFLITTTLADSEEDLDERARTAIVMPIADEPVERVFAGLRAMDRSLARTGAADHFDFFVLSDTADPATWVKEEEAWLDWCRGVDGFGRIFYRRRRVRVKRKSGNIADFCRRFGRRYRYMITLDADSMMSGETIVRLARMMEANPAAGLIQTAPLAVHARTLYARIQQFANHVYGPLFAAGMHFWQLGDAQYWGHNAIVRLAPFMKHCSLPRLPGRPPFGGEILSHDFVEAAMLGRAGYSIWLAYDMDGSYEELPSSLLEDLARDRRWAQGNFQHLRLVLVEGLFHVHRALFLNGVFAYVSALLWFCFLALSTLEAILRVVIEPDYFPSGPSLFPQWPVWRPDWAIALLTVTLAILFVPKILSALLVFRRPGGARPFGGPTRFLLSVVLEFLASSLFAPIRMLFHTKFVLTNLIGRIVVWRSPPRGDHETTWREAARRHGAATVLATVWGGVIYWLNPSYAWWLAPIVGALIVSIPVSVLVSRVSVGAFARRHGLFRTPQESDLPAELVELNAYLTAAAQREREMSPQQRDGFVRGVIDPYVNALHRWLLRGPRLLSRAVRDKRAALVDRALHEGPSALGVRVRRILLTDAECVEELHRRVWQLPNEDRARAWGVTPPPSAGDGS